MSPRGAGAIWDRGEASNLYTHETLEATITLCFTSIELSLIKHNNNAIRVQRLPQMKMFAQGKKGECVVGEVDLVKGVVLVASVGSVLVEDLLVT